MLFSELPIEVRLHVLQQLDIKSLLSVMQVSTQLFDESCDVLSRKNKTELAQNLSDLVTHLNQHIGHLKLKLSSAEAQRDVYVNEAIPFTAIALIAAKFASVMLPVVDSYLLYNTLTTPHKNTLASVKDVAIDLLIGLIEIPIVVGIKKANQQVAQYDEAKKNAFDNVRQCEKALQLGRQSAQRRLQLARQRITNKANFFAHKVKAPQAENLQVKEGNIEKQPTERLAIV